MEMVIIDETVQLLDNLLPEVYNFENDTTFSIVSGTGTAETQSGISYSGLNSLRLNNTDYNGSDLVANLYTTPLTLFNTGKFCISTYFYNSSNITSGLLVQLQVYKNTALFATYDIDLDLETDLFPQKKWKRYFQIFENSSGSNDYTFKLILKSDTGSSTADVSVYMDGFKVEKYDKGQFQPSPYQNYIPKVYQSTESVDVPSISSNDTHQVDIELTGAEVGDFISGFIYPIELISLGLVVGQPIVTDTNTVSFLIHNHTGGSINPATGDYTVKIVK